MTALLTLTLFFAVVGPVSGQTLLHATRDQQGDPLEEVDISRTLVRNQIRGCGEYTYKTAGKAEYHVACWSAAGVPTYYIVFTSTGKVMGPYAK